MKTTILGGVLFLAPLVVLAILLGKAFEISLKVAHPINRAIQIDSYLGVASVNILAILLILAVCLAAGKMARWAFFHQRLRKLDGVLIDFIPAYAVFKTVVTSASAQEGLDAMMTPVLLRLDDQERIGFEIERQGGKAVVFLPGAPSAWTGSTVVVELERLRPLDIPAHQAVRLQRAFGRGSLVVAARQGPPAG